MRIVKVIEVIATSDKGFTEATHNAVEQASKTVKNITSVEVKEMHAKVENQKIVSYTVHAKISFEVND